MSDAKSVQDRNRENAQHSTGPRTAEGKAKSAQNARKHGLNAHTIHLPEDRMEEVLSLFSSLHTEICPMGELQSQFFEQLVHASWQQQIARTMLVHAQLTLDDRRIALAHRYIAQYERSFAKALKEIKALQADLALRAAVQNEPIAELPTSCEIRSITREAARIASFAERTQRQSVRHEILVQIGTAFERVSALGHADTPIGATADLAA